MANLQKVNLGAIPDGAGGDDARTAFNRGNTNVDVLNAQTALTSLPTITAAQALTVAHVGKRINISLAAAGVVNLPVASTCAADNVIHLRNSGATIVTLAITGGSGDTVALSKLNPGEAALMDTDGVHAWTVLMRGRTNLDNEVVNGSLAVLGASAFGSTGQATISATGAYSGTSAAYSGNVTVGGTLGVTGAATFAIRPSVAGNAVWDAGNFSPANYAALATANSFAGPIAVAGGGWTAAQASFRNTPAQVWACSAYASTQSGGAFIGRVDNAANALAAWFFGANNVGLITTNGASTTYGTTSDYRLKADWREIDDPVSVIMRIKFYEGEFKAQPGVLSHYAIAHELQEVLCYAVVGEKDAVDKDGKIKPQFVDYSKLVPLLGAAIQRQQITLRKALERIAELEAK